MSSSTRTIVLFGSGPGVGQAVAGEFAAKGFGHIVLVSRNGDRLKTDRDSVMASSKKARVDVVTGDLSDPDSMKKALQQIDNLVQNVEVVVVNGARVAPSELFGTSAEVVIKDFKITTIGLYLVSEWALPKLQAFGKAHPSSTPTIIVTCGMLHKYPEPTFFSLTVAKTAQRSLAEILHKVYNDEVHVGLVCIGGIVTPSNKVLNPKSIAEKTWEFFNDKGFRNELEVEMYEP